MPIAAPIAVAAASYSQNTNSLTKGFEGLAPEEWLRRPGEKSNHLSWVVGHIIWARAAVAGMLGSPFSKPWFPLVARGSKIADAAEYPSSAELSLALQEVTALLNTAMENASEEALSVPAPGRTPSADGKLSGTVSFLAWHDTFHVGQAAYLRCWLGHSGAHS
jgi:hypothetical protein